jgi:hypothetical protein
MVVVMLRRSTKRLRSPPGSGQPRSRGKQRGAEGGRKAAGGGHRGAKVGSGAEIQGLLRKNGPAGYLRPQARLSHRPCYHWAAEPGPASGAGRRRTARREELPAQDILLQPGRVARRVYFLEQGLVRGYALHAGREVSSWFMREGDFVISIVSFLTQAAATEYLQLLEALAEFPGVLQRVALRHIASHLGVAAETLSWLRGRK